MATFKVNALLRKTRIAAVLAAVMAVPLAEADVLRVGVASAGGGDPVTFSGSPLGIVRNQQLLEKAFAGTGTEVQWFFFKGAGLCVSPKPGSSRRNVFLPSAPASGP